MKKKLISFYLFFFILYITIGMLAPFYRMRAVSTAYLTAIDTNSFYGCIDSNGPDRAGIIETNQDALDVRLAMIEDAQEEIVITTFDIRSGRSTTDIFAALYAAADRGVQIKIIVDGMNGVVHMGMAPEFYAAGSHPNITIKFYNTPNLFKPWTIHGRMHDKYMIVDRKLLLAGGRNLFDYFLGTFDDIPAGQDREVLILKTEKADGDDAENPSASCIDTVIPYFEDMWSGKVCREAFQSVPPFGAAAAERSRQMLNDHYQNMSVADWDYLSVTFPTNNITFLANPTHIYGKEPYIWEQLYQLMIRAEERVVIHTPYLVCSPEMYDGLADIAARVPQTDIMVNSIGTGDNVCASSDYRLNQPDILATGITLYEYMGDSSTHGKSLIIDQDIAVVGSYNFDNRSTYVDTETMFVIHSEAVNQQLDRHMNGLKQQTLQVNPDGSYKASDDITPSQLPITKNVVIRLLSLLIQPVRFLI